MRIIATLLLASVAAPVLAQDHEGHEMPAAPSTAQTECEKEAARHRAMGHRVPDGACAPQSQADAVDAEKPTAEIADRDHSQMDHSKMDPGEKHDTDQSQMDHGERHGTDHSQMDHSEMEGMDHSQMDHNAANGSMDHSTMDHSDMDHGAMEDMDHSQMDMAPIPAGPPPVSAGSGPPRAADAIWGADAMQGSRDALRIEQGGMSYFWFQADRAEYRAREGSDGYLWDLQGYFGGDIDKFWFKSEGEGSFGEKPESAEVQALWSHAIGPWWDFQTGIRQDLTGPERTHAVIGLQGLAPYQFEVDAAAFLSTKGDLTALIEGELDQRVTQRLILQPRAEVSLSAQDIPELGVGAGLDTIEVGVRLRYEFAREFAPYVGVEQEWKIGQSADYARLEGEDPSVTNYVIGVRFWF